MEFDFPHQCEIVIELHDRTSVCNHCKSNRPAIHCLVLLASTTYQAHYPKNLDNSLNGDHSKGFGGNHFSCSLPPDLGNLSKLQQLWARNIELSGRIPDFIGNWSKLSSLRLQGNSFAGPIPSAFSNLTSMKELRITDLSNANGSSSLALFKNMKTLNILELGNNNISDSIPSDIGVYQNLSQLDVCFNNSMGQVPDSLFNLSSLSILFLGNNKLSGSLPVYKAASLLNVDLSYNYLEGSFPSWAKQENLKCNLVGKNFSIESIQNSGLPAGLACHQRNFPCNRGPGIYYNFGINCGGPEVTSASDGIVYDKENESLGPASDYVHRTSRWGVSNVGYFTRTTNPQYTSFSSSLFTNTFDSVLFQTARLFAASIRYYGLGLENGKYTVNLKFAEHVILAASTGAFLGRCVLDIYIQGNLVSKSFDILKEAGMSSFQAVQKQYTAHVLENYLEIHLFWDGKGSCCVPARGTYGPAIAAISATPDFIPTVRNKSPTSKKNKTGLIVGIVVGGGGFFILLVVVFHIVKRGRRPKFDDEEGLYGIDVGTLTFSYSELRIATNDFDPANKLGEGGFGPV